MITRHTLFLASLPFVAVAVAILTPESSNAAIIWSQSTNVQQVNGTDFWVRSRTQRSTTTLFAFDEAQNVVVNQNQGIKTSKKNPNYIANSSFANYDPSIPKSGQASMLEYDWDSLTNLPILPTGTYNSHFVYMFSSGGRAIVNATLVFDGAIKGLMGDPSLTNASNFLFFPTATRSLSLTGTLEGLGWYDPATRDYIKVTGANNNILQIRMTTESLENLRIITAVPAPLAAASVAAAPEPLTILGSGTAITFAAFFKRKLSKKKENN